MSDNNSADKIYWPGQYQPDFWKDLSLQEQKAFLNQSKTKEFKRRDPVIHSGDEGLYLYIVIEGRIKVGKYFADFKEIMTDLVYVGDVLSVQPLAEFKDRLEYAEAVMPSRILQLNVDFVRQLMTSNLGFSKYMFSQVTKKYNRINLRLALVHPTILIKQQFVELLLLMAEDFGRSIGVEVLVEHGLSQNEMASMLHRSRQSVTGVMCTLKKANIINYTRTSILIRDMEKLRTWR